MTLPFTDRLIDVHNVNLSVSRLLLLGQVRIQSWHHPHTVCSQWRSNETDPMPLANFYQLAQLSLSSQQLIPILPSLKKKSAIFPGKEQICVWFTFSGLLSWITLLWTNTSHACIQAKKRKILSSNLVRQGCFLNPKDSLALTSFWKYLEDKFQLLARCSKVWSLTWSSAHHKRIFILFLIGKPGWGKDGRNIVFKVHWELFVLHFRKVWYYIGARYLKCTLSHMKTNVIILICFQLQTSQNICVCMCTHAKHLTPLQRDIQTSQSSHSAWQWLQKLC